MRLWALFFFICCGHLFGYDPIDIVYTWVDGSDPVWAAKRDFYMQRDKPWCKEGTLAQRFRDKDELKYSLRSIYAFAPFVRHIFIVTDGQRPKWLKDHPRITVVSHQDIFRWKEHLPVFNSEAIEANLHRIPGLAERYIYFNDDVFLGRPVTPNDFFTEKGKIRFYEGRKIPNVPLMKDPTSLNRRAWNTSEELKRVYGHDIELHFFHHTPHAMRKTVVRHAEQMFPHVFKSCSADRFRSSTTYRTTSCLIQYVGLYTERAQASKTTFHDFPFRASSYCNRRHMDTIITKRPTFFCVQDLTPREASAEATGALSRFFEEYFPTPAPWEKQDKNNAIKRKKQVTLATR